jgi:hypothetical protein
MLIGMGVARIFLGKGAPTKISLKIDPVENVLPLYEAREITCLK